MAPNIALITASVTAIHPYAKQAGFSILILAVKQALPRKSAKFLYDPAEKTIQALINNDKLEVLNLKKADKVCGELKKVSPDLWRVIEENFTLI